MEIDCARDFMEVLIQQGQGRNSMFTTVLSSHQKRTAKRLLLSLRLRQKKRKKKKKKRKPDDSTGSGWQRQLFFSATWR